MVARGGGGRGGGGGRREGVAAAAALFILMLAFLSIPVSPTSFAHCKHQCYTSIGRGTCQEDGTCACNSGWTGEGCAQESPGISKEKRRDGTYGYSFTTNAEKNVGAAVFDPQKKVLYLSVYDAVSGADSVIEVDPLNPTTFASGGFTSRGWGDAVGPRRADRATKQPNPLTPDPGYCGTALEIQSATGCTTVKHPRAEGYKDSATSRGWYSVFRGLALDRSGSLTGVYGVLNMHGATALDPMYLFKIVKYVGTDCSAAASWEHCVTGSANAREPSFTYPAAGSTKSGILDAMSSNEVTGHVVYKFSPTDGTSRGTIGMLTPTLTLVSETAIQANTLATSCPMCATAHDALKFETAMYAQTGGKNYVIFAGAARMETDGTSYPAIFKVNANSEAEFTAASGGGSEMYLDSPSDLASGAVKVESVCEGVVDSKQGRFTTFTALTNHGSYGYAGTSGRDENCANCQHRSACIFMFRLDFASGARPTKMIELNGGNGGLDEKDVWAAAVEPDSSVADGGFIYFAVGPRSNTAFGRIVKVMIGGTDTATSCTSGCFKRVGTFKETLPFGGVTYVADLYGIVSLSQAALATTYTKFSTASVTSISPQFVHAATAGAVVTITGSGFYSHNHNGDTTSKSANVSCRFGHTSTSDTSFQNTGWSAATFISSTEIRCTVPSSSNSLSTSTTYADVQISFDGFPVGDVSSLEQYWQSGLWSNDNAVVFYYDTPFITALDVSSSGTFLSKVMLTGEDPDNAPMTLRVYGGRFIDSDGSGTLDDGTGTPRLKCRYDGDATSDIAGTFKNKSEVWCPLCVASGSNRCGDHGTSGAAQYIPFAWLTNGTPKSNVDVSITMNGIDFHSSGALVLHVYGTPYGLSVTHSRITAQAYKANAETDGTSFKLDGVTVDLVDVQGTTVPNDMGLGGTRGFTITAAVNATGSPGGSSAQLVVTSASATKTTVAGTATFDLVLDAVPLVGMYQIYFTGADCTQSGISCTALGATAAFTFTIEEGIATGLTVDPGGTSGSFVTGPDFPTDTTDVTAAQSVRLGYVIVNTVDAGGNKLESLDTSSHNITASVVTSQVVADAHVARTSGAVLAGTTSTLTAVGLALFLDLTLDAAAPSGSRAPNALTDVVYGDPTRGAHGTETKYLLQFSATLAASTAVAHTVVRVSVGAAAYLRLNGSAYSVISMDATEVSVLIPQSIKLGAYDGGNNWVGTLDSLNRTVTVSSPSVPALTLAGTLSTAMDATGTWTFATEAKPLYATTPTIGEYTLRFSSDGLQSVDQIIKVTLGKKGYQLYAKLPANFGPYPSTSIVNFNTFTIQVLDGGGNFMSTADRFLATDVLTVTRTISFSSTTLQLIGTGTGTAPIYTLGDGVVTSSALSCIAPKEGTHVVVAREVGAVVNGEGVGTSLNNGSFTIVISKGSPSKLNIDGSPLTVVSSSIGAHLTAAEVIKYATDRIVPLDTFTVNTMDDGENLLTSLSNYYINTTAVVYSVATSKTSVLLTSNTPTSNSSVQLSPELVLFDFVSLLTNVETYLHVTMHTEVSSTHVTTYNTTIRYTVTRTLTTDRIVTATLNDTSREAYPYTISDNMIFNREAVLVASQSYSRNGSMTVTSSSGTAIFPALHLSKPAVGTYQLTFSSSDVSIQAATALINVVTGRSQQLGLPSPCPVALDASNYLACTTSSTCTCNQYLAATQLALNTLEVLVLDAGLNPVFENDTLPCEDCTNREVALAAEQSSLVVCREVTTNASCECMGGDGTTTRSLSGNVCASVRSFNVTSLNGVARYEGVFLMTPTVSTQYGAEGYKLLFSSPGLLDVRFGLKVSEGTGYALKAEAPSVFPPPATDQTTFRSSYVTEISTILESTVVRVLILDGGGNFVSDTEPSGRIIYATCATATLEKYPQAIGVGGSYYAVTCMKGRCPAGEEAGVAKFRHLQFLRPKAGTHVIIFSGLGLTVETSYTVKVLQGDPVALKVVTFSPTVYEAATVVNLASAEVAVIDAGENLVGTANPITRLLRVVITGPRHNFIIDNNQDEAILLQSRGSATFDSLSLETPAYGVYTLTFASSGLISAVQTLTMNFGPSTRLYLPVAFNLSSSVQIVPKTVYAALIATVLKPVVALILDGGLNYVADGARNVTVTSDRGNMTYTMRNSSLGYLLFDDITFHRPSVGTYTLTYTSGTLTPITRAITIQAGYPAILDVCRSNVLLTRNKTSGLCDAVEPYKSSVQVTLHDFQVSLLDAGRIFVGDSWNSEKRNVTVALESFTDVFGTTFSDAVHNPLKTDYNGTQEVQDGLIGWCTNGYDANPEIKKKIDSATGELVEYTVYTESSPSFCRRISYSGNAPDVYYNAGVKFSRPKTGIYMLRFASECPFKYCGNAIYPNLQVDTLRIQIVPGTPHEMRFVNKPPAVNENDFQLNPAPSIDVFDVAENLCTLTNTFMTVDVAPRTLRLHGNVVPLVEGKGAFTSLRFNGERGKTYRLIFELHAYGLKLEHFPFTILSCETVKPNSYADEKGRCHCLPGYTEDTVNGTGYVDDLNNYNVAGVSLYKPVVYETGPWLDALHPYGICVPCAIGYFKPYAGSHPCTRCPVRFDTSRKDGLPSPPHNSSSGKILPGSLGKTKKEDCHCVVQLEPPFDSFYRNVSTSEKYKCEPCPPGGSCTGLGIEEIRAQPGYKRVSRSTIKFTACPNPDSCLGGVESTCLAVNGSGHGGTLCVTCLSGYAHPSVNGRFPPKCLECGNVGLNLAQFFMHWVAVIVIIAVIARLNVRRGSDAVCLIRTFISYLQTVSIAKELDMKWPDSAAGYMLFIEKISSVNFQSAPAQCLLSWDYYSTTGFYISLPIMLAGLSLLYFSIGQFLEDQKNEVSSMRRRGAQDDEDEEEEEDEGAQSPILNSKVLRTKKRIEAMDDATFGESWESKAFDKVCMVGVICLWFMYPTLVQYLVGLIRCKRLDAGPDVYLMADMSIKCYDSMHSSWLFLLFICTVLYIFGIPLGLTGLLESEGQNHGTLAMRFRVGILYKGHDVDNAWWWELVTFGRKGVLVAIVVLFSDSVRIGSYVAVWLLEACFILHLLATPYANQRQHRMESYGLLAAIITFNCGILYLDGSAGLVNTVLTLVIFAVHIGMWLLLVQSLMEEFAAEGRTAMIARAQHDIQLEDNVADEFEIRRDGGAAENRKAEKLAQLNSIAGAHLPFADDDLLEHIEKGSVPEIREEHTKLSSKLNDMRKTWSERRAEKAGKKYLVDEAHRGTETTAAERWRQRRENESITLVPREGGERSSWRDKMANK